MCSQFGSWSIPELPETPMPYDQRRCDVCDCELRVGFPQVRDPQTGHWFAITRCPELNLHSNLRNQCFARLASLQALEDAAALPPPARQAELGSSAKYTNAISN